VSTEYLAYEQGPVLVAPSGARYIACRPLGTVEGSGASGRERRRHAAAEAHRAFGVAVEAIYLVPAARVPRRRRAHLLYERAESVERAAREAL